MIVSAYADAQRRLDVANDVRPQPEFLRLEEDHGVTLLDWTQLGLSSGHRSVGRSLRHVRAALSRLSDFDVVFSDGEHVGIPLALSMSMLRRRTPHVMLGHHLITRSKIRVFRTLRPQRRIDRIVVHSPNQVAEIERELGVAPDKIAVVPYGVDTDFWERPRSTHAEEPDLVVSAGREHRDYATLMAARPDAARLAIADHSLFSPEAERSDPNAWSADVERLALEPAGLRDLYARAAVVAVPVVETTFPAGITTLLEAMAMGKAVVVAETAGLRGIVENRRTGIVVAPGDADAMGAAIRELLASPALREELGGRARERAVAHHGLEVYCNALARQLAQAGGREDRIPSP
jgi:glycosyltransferase involved in cell wall biosynthesis